MNDDQRKQLRSRCREIHGHRSQPIGDALANIAKWCQDNDVGYDVYGGGEFLESFEKQLADKLGFEAARFMPSGTLAQPIALRIWADRAGVAHVGMHPTAHLELHEQRAYAHLHQLRATLVGPADRPLLAEHLRAVAEPIAALLIELPIREAGGQLPTWDELSELKAAARERSVKLHLDGARLWEAAAGYDKSLAAICDGFDSAYVSFYKGIGALPGSMLLGSSDFIDEAKLWQRRSGGNLYTLTPNAASAAMQLDARLAAMPAHLARAREIAAALAPIEGVRVLPEPPHVNMMHVFLALEPDDAIAARDRVAEATGLWLFRSVRPAGVPGHCRFELYVGDAAMAVGTDDIASAFRALLKSA